MADPNRDYDRVEKAIRFLNQHASEQPSLDEVAAAVGLTRFHFQRLFTRWAGVSPKRFLQHLTLETAKRTLGREESLFNATLDAGLSSPSRLHDLFVTIEAMTPGEYKNGGEALTIRWGLVASPFGPCLISRTQRGICGLDFPGDEVASDPENDVATRWPRATLKEERRRTTALAEEIFSPLDGKTPTPLSLHVKGTNFQLQVWRALLTIEAGKLDSYGGIAQKTGNPTSSRAVGQAVGSNPVSYLVPCHRVLASSGAIGGYHWGRERKQAMLAREDLGAALRSGA